ncbi:uncharacterized protein [Phaseolus vulgaris]|uniref:uncharacterized protein isoform X2 n=1 Tax=Phaseolus vulgaris TaxID=3885 RepID=UPI0035CB0F12
MVFHIHLLLLFSLTATLILPARSSNSNTWSVFQGVKHLWTKNKALDKGNHGGHLKLNNLFMGCEDIKKCSSMTQSPGSDEFAKDTPENDVHRVLSANFRNETSGIGFQYPPPDSPYESIRNETNSSLGANSSASPAPAPAPAPAPVPLPAPSLSISPLSIPTERTTLGKHLFWKSKVIIDTSYSLHR